ncbi:MAG: bifunctional DNA primase/polymerase [Acidimicrobiales bacterium]
MSTTSMLDAAVSYASAGWPVFPLQPRSKTPFKGSHAKNDGSTDLDEVRAMWTGRRLATIAARVPDDLVVLDVDPYHGGEETLAAIEAGHGPLPPTLTQITGSGGRHLFFVHPGGRLHTPPCFSPGVDLRVGGRHYVVLPPSIHASGRPYAWVEPLIPPAPVPGWLRGLLAPPPVVRPPRRLVASGPRPGDVLEAATTWADILEPAGWVLVGERGSVGHWRRPGKPDGISATTDALGTDRLHVFTSSAPPLEPDTSYSRFGAFAALHHNGDHTAAARALREAS